MSQQKRVNCRCKADPNPSTRVEALISQRQASRNKAGQRAAEESIRAQHQRRVVWFWHGCGLAATQCGRQGGPFQPSPVLLIFVFFLRGKRADQRRRVKLTRCMAWGSGGHGMAADRRHDTTLTASGPEAAGLLHDMALVCRWALAGWQDDGSWTHRRAEQPTLTPTQLRVSSTLPDPGAQPQVGLELIPTSRADCSRPSSPSIVGSPP